MLMGKLSPAVLHDLPQIPPENLKRRPEFTSTFKAQNSESVRIPFPMESDQLSAIWLIG